MGVSIVSTINIGKIHLDMNGFYQCVGVHQEIYAQQTFNVHVNTNGKFNNNKKGKFVFSHRYKFNSNKFFYRCIYHW
jgi:hypothetical protein